MMQNEFEALAGYRVSAEDYMNIIEPMYSATSATKQEFIKMIDRRRFEVKAPEQKIIKVMNIADNSGCLKTPNNCYRHLVDVEIVSVNLRTGKIKVKVVEGSYRLGYSADFTQYDPRIEILR